MRSLFRHIPVVFAAILLVFASCRKEDAKVIPRGKLAKIYAEMLVTDQWITTTPGIRQIADTSLVYEPILEKYGYTSADYRRSVDHYMNDPERFSRILRTSSEILDKRLRELRRQLHDINEAKNAPKITSDFKAEEFFPYLAKEPYVHYYDSIAVRLDSILYVYELLLEETADTVYDGVNMMIRVDSLAIKDSLAVRDSLARIDSLAVADSLARVDSLAKAGSMAKAAFAKKVGSRVKTDTAVRAVRSKPVKRPVYKKVLQ